jgi:uncharacterized protein
VSVAADVSFAVRVRPGASRTAVGGRYDGQAGPALVVAVTAPAVEGRATEAARLAIASALGLRPAAVTLRTGETSRDKVFTVLVEVAGRTLGTSAVAASAQVRSRLEVLRDGRA